MMQWFRIVSLTLAVGVIAALPVSAQPGRRGGSDSGDSVKQTSRRTRAVDPARADSARGQTA